MENITPVYINNLIIVVAVYINNDNKNYIELIKCLQQLRCIYKNETIIAVDNNSLNNKWFEIAKSLHIIILSNTSKLHRFEIGAYKLALQHYRSDKYIFIQGTIFLNNKLELTSLDAPIPNATAFQLLHNNLCWSDTGLILINHLLESIQMKKWNNDPIVLWNCFCCNNLFNFSSLRSLRLTRNFVSVCKVILTPVSIDSISNPRFPESLIRNLCPFLHIIAFAL